MGSKGESKIEKRLVTSKARKINRKEKTFTIKSKPGPHKRKDSVPLGFVLRDLLGIVENMKEAKFILNNSEVKVDGRIVKDARFPVGLFDIISIEKIKKEFRMLFDRKGRLFPEEIKGKEKLVKLSKVVGKKTVKGKKIQIETNDGRNFVLEKTKLKIGDSVKISVPDQKILEEIELKQGALVYVCGGTHIGMIAKVREITPGTMKRPKLVTLKPEGEDEIQTIESNVFAVGEGKPVLEEIKQVL